MRKSKGAVAQGCFLTGVAAVKGVDTCRVLFKNV